MVYTCQWEYLGQFIMKIIILIKQMLSFYDRGRGMLKKLASKIKASSSKRQRIDSSNSDSDSDYHPSHDTSQPSVDADVSVDQEPQIDEALDISHWAFEEKRWNADQYNRMRNPNQYKEPRDTNIQYFHTQIQLDAFWSHIRHVNFHEHKTIDWQYMLEQPVMDDLVGKFTALGLKDFLAHRVDYNEMVIR
jgi:hypothetical protein